GSDHSSAWKPRTAPASSATKQQMPRAGAMNSRWIRAASNGSRCAVVPPMAMIALRMPAMAPASRVRASRMTSVSIERGILGNAAARWRRPGGASRRPDGPRRGAFPARAVACAGMAVSRANATSGAAMPARRAGPRLDYAPSTTQGGLPMADREIAEIKRVFVSRLDTLAHILDTGARHIEDFDATLQARLAPDMAPLGTQVVFACN